MSLATTNYTLGYSTATTSSHARRTVHSDAGFLIPHLKLTDKVLDVGCGPGTITIGLGSLVPEGSVIGIDISDEVLDQARAALSPDLGANTTFQKADLLAGLPFPADSFDVVFSSQLFPHLATRDMKLKALTEMRRVLKPGGILATRDIADMHFYPRDYGLDSLWGKNLAKALSDAGAGDGGWFPGEQMPALYRRAGFADVSVGAGTTVHSGAEECRWFAERIAQRLSVEDPYREVWKQAGIREGEIEETREALGLWAGDENAWYVAVQAEVLARK